MADLLARGRRTASASLRAQYGTEIGKKQLNELLNILLSQEKSFSEDTKEWCTWLIAGGESPEVFLDKLRVYDSSRTCGLVWHKNFVAYRCRDCGTSPCMSICADCFLGGDHRGHDYNMFRSQAGGACDCGDENVMKREGFCSTHGKLRVSLTPPNDVLYMAKSVIPHLFNRLYKDVEPFLNSDESITAMNDDVNKLVEFLQELCNGEVIRSVVCDVIVQECQDITYSSADMTCEDSETSLCPSFTPDVCYQNHMNCCEKESISYLDLLLDIVIKLDFPEKLVTFLLQLLPNQKYKVAFTQRFCQKYQEIGKALTLCSTLQEVEQLSNSVVHISVQLFSNQILVTKMVREQNLLHVMIKVIQEMVRSTFQPMKVNDQSVQHLVIDCEKNVIKFHCYWPVISDLINVLTHDSIAYIFMQDLELIEKWMVFLTCLTGMNGNKRVISGHVEYEPVAYSTAYVIEIEAASPLWSLIAASSVLNDKSCIMNIFHRATIALNKWLKKISQKPSRSEVTFHLPLLRYLTAFVRQGLSQFNMGLQDFQWDFSLLTRILDWPTNIQAAVCEIRAGLWTRNGSQIQTQSLWYKQCNFCNSMFDLDLFFMQICAAQLDPNYFLSVLLDRFRVHDWFQFRPTMNLNPGIDDDAKEIMVEGVLTLIVTLLTCRLHFGMKEEETLRLEMVTALCFADKTHSQLTSMVPERSGQTLNAQLFEKILKEISDYKHPGCDSNGMQQGMYTLKQQIWDSDFDPVHAMMRAIYRRQFQSAMDRYTAHVRQRDSSNVASLWPPFRPLKPVPESFNGIFRLLHCKKLHQMLYFILYKATSSVIPLSESIIYLTIHLITLAIQSRPSLFERLPCPYQPSISDINDAGCIVVSKCLNFLSNYGKDIKNLHRDEDYSVINNVLFSKIFSDPEATLTPNKVSVREVSLILGHTLHYSMEPPLFSSILPYMNTVLSNALNNSCSQSEKESHLRHIQFLLETLPAHRYNVIKKLISYLVKFIVKDDIPMQNISIIFYVSQPLELTMLFMYLIKYYEQVFRVYQPPDGLPRDISSLAFPSNNLVENIRYEPRLVSCADTLHSSQVKTPDEDVLETSVSSSSTLASSTQNSDNLVQEFIEITNASIDTAIFILEQCPENLETAINLYFESTLCFDETMSESSSNMAMEVELLEPDHGTLASWCSRENLSSSASADTMNVSRDRSVDGGHLTDSILSLSMKLKTVLSLSITSPVSPRSPGMTVVNDGVRKLETLLDIISQSSSSNVEAIGKLDSPSYSLSPTKDEEDPLAKQELKRKIARERQKKLMNEFASKQQEFLKNVCEQDGSEEVDSGVCCKRSLTELFDCAICGQRSVPSSEEEPMGYVAFLQSGAVLKHRRRSDASRILCISKENTSTDSCYCGSVYAARKQFLSTYFNKVAATQASELGIDRGVHIQSCGHCLHLKCQQSYLHYLMEEQQSPRHQSRAFDPTKGEFICPVCRRLGNAILPILPSDVMAPTCNKSKDTCHQEVMAELEMTLTNCSSNWTRLTKSALKLSVLSASISSFVEIINRLDLSKENDHHTMSENKFALIVETARCNLETEHIALLQTGKLFCKRRPFYGALLRTLQYQSQTLVRPLFHVLALLTGKPVESYDLRLDSEITRNDVPLLLRDGVSLLLQLILSWPAPLTLRPFRCLVQIVFNVVFIQALVKTCCTFTEDERLSWQVSAKKFQEKRQMGFTTDALLGYVCSLVGGSKLCQGSQECPGISQSVWSPQTVESTIQKLCLPFLRMVSSLSTLCYSTDHPVIQDEENEFFLLTLSLGLHQQSRNSQTSSVLSVSDCFKCSHGCPLFLVKKWCTQLSTISRSHEIFPKDLIPGTDDWQAPRLFPLPEHYDSLFQTYRKEKCVKCGTNPEEPTLCLVCGTFVCLRGKCCERKGIRECVEHAVECGYGTAVYLIMMSSTIFIIRGEKASVWGSVYLDEFGEEDLDLRRGKPLYLSTDRYKRLEEQWITHTFDSICKIWKRHDNNF